MSNYRSWRFSQILHISNLIDRRAESEALMRRILNEFPIVGSHNRETDCFRRLFGEILHELDAELATAQVELDAAKTRHFERKKRHIPKQPQNSPQNDLSGLARYEASE